MQLRGNSTQIIERDITHLNVALDGFVDVVGRNLDATAACKYTVYSRTRQR